MKEKPTSLFIGIDPGATGAIALLCSTDMSAVVVDFDCRCGCGGALSHLEDWIIQDWPVFIESVGAMPKQGVVSSFNFGRAFGEPIGVLKANGREYTLVRPQAWKKHFGLIKKDKGASLELARRLFPDVDLSKKKHHNRAEALLIAEYGRFLVTGEKRAY